MTDSFDIQNSAFGICPVPPKGNANFAWVQHFIHHLAPGGAGTAGSMVGFVLANGSMSSNQSGEGDIRRALIEADREMPSAELRTKNRPVFTSTFVLHPSNFAPALPGQLFYSTQIPVCLRFLGKHGNASAKPAAFKTAQIQNNAAMAKSSSIFQLT